jgi:Tfp pilus assembly protein PilF
VGKVVQLPTRRRDHYRPVHKAVTELNNIALMRGAKYQHIATGIVEMKRAIAVQPNSCELWANMGALFWKSRQYDEALACADRSMTMGVIAEAMHVKALVLEDQHKFEEAEACFAQAIEIDPKYLNAKWCRSMMRLSLGDYERGWEEYETRIPFRQQEGKKVYPKFPAPYWQGEPIQEKNIFCCIEQGIGDTILFSRFLPWLDARVGIGGRVYLCCGHEIMVLLWNFVETDVVEYVPEGTPIPECDYSVVIGSLPWHSRCTLDALPGDPGLIRRRVDTQMRIGKADVPAPLGPNAYKVGICWTGNPAQERNDERSIPLELMLQLAEHPNVWLYSLQVGPGQADIARLGARDIVCDLGPQLKERGLTVAATAILQMDLVITCCTSIAHLCGSLGKEAWVVLCKNPYWVWMHERLDSPWYPSLRLFRQTKTDDWKSVMQQVKDELFERLDARRRKETLRQ